MVITMISYWACSSSMCVSIIVTMTLLLMLEWLLQR